MPYMSQSAATKQQLQDAFELFNRASARLSGSFRGLQQQVLYLNDELAAARGERQQLLAEIQCLQAQVSRGRRLSAMSEMAARLAHQIRTPLSTAILYASQLCDPRLGESRHRAFVDRLLDGLRHLDAMVNDTLEFTAAGPGEAETISVGRLLAGAEKTLGPALERQAAHWQVSGADLQLRAQTQVLGNALVNLAQNSLQAAGRGARLHWAARRCAGGIELELTDNGCGVPAVSRQQIFEPFFTTRTKGTGLGLAVVRAVMLAHGGEIGLDDNYRGGARFRMFFPCTAQPDVLPGDFRNQQETDQQQTPAGTGPRPV
jgi:two-component system sensor histidine kinase FlrB